MQRILASLASLCLLTMLAFPAAAFADVSFQQELGQLEQMYQLPTGILAKVAYVENGGRSTGCAPTSSACGMFQWTTSSWLAATKALWGQPYDLSGRNDPSISAKVTAFALADAKSKLGGLIQRSGIDMTVGLYLSHFLGLGGAQTFFNAYIQNPGQNACALFPAGCAANGSVMQRSLSGVVNLFAAKLQAPGVLNVPGNFADSSGVSYAYSYADLNANSFLPANTVIPRDPTLDYPQTFTPAATAPVSQPATTGSLPSSIAPPPPPQSTAPQSTPTPTVTPTTQTATSGSACTPQYYCSNNTVYYHSDSCSTTVFQNCNYGCLGTICAPSPSSASSSLNVSSSGTSGALSSDFGILGTAATIGTSGSIAATSSLSPSLDTSVAAIGTAESPWQSASGLSSSSTSTDQQYNGVTLTGGTEHSYPTVESPFFQVLDQLRSVLTGLLSYLGSL